MSTTTLLISPCPGCTLITTYGAPSYPSCLQIEQARIEQRARELLQQSQDGGGKGPSELVVEGGGPAEGPAVVTDAELDAELQKIATLDLDAVREEQQKYMKEKRGLNIARRTWYGRAGTVLHSLMPCLSPYLHPNMSLNHRAIILPHAALLPRFESFRDREGRPPSDEEAKEEMGEIEHKLTKLDEIVAALQRRSLELAKAAWSTGPEAGDQK